MQEHDDEPDPWSPQRLTRAAWVALALAAERARGAVQPMDLWAALAGLRPSVAERVLRSLGLSWASLGLASPQAPVVAPPAELLGPDTERFLRGAAEEARRLGHHPVGTGHLLVALLAEETGPLPLGCPLDHARARAALCEVLARPWVHGWALDGEVCLYLTRDEALLLFAHLLRREPQRHAHAAERQVLGALRELLRPVGELLLAPGEQAATEARARVLRLGMGLRARG